MIDGVSLFMTTDIIINLDPRLLTSHTLHVSATPEVTDQSFEKRKMGVEEGQKSIFCLISTYFFFEEIVELKNV